MDSSNNWTPLKEACDKFGRDEVEKVVENTIAIADCYYSGNNNNKNNNNNSSPYNPAEAFLTAVSDKNIISI